MINVLIAVSLIAIFLSFLFFLFSIWKAMEIPDKTEKKS